MTKPMVLVPDSEVSRKFGSILKHRRRRIEMTQGDLAREVGISVSMVSMIETGQRIPSRTLAAQLLLALDEGSSHWSEKNEKILVVVDPVTKQEEQFLLPDPDEPKDHLKERVPTQLVREEHIRLECLKVAAQVTAITHPEVIMQVAKTFEEFVKTGNTTPKEA